MKKLFLLALVSSAMSTSVFAAKDMGHGKVNFKGSIIDAPCSISPDSIDQTVELGQISNMALVDGGKSSPRSFDIALENCDVTGLKEGVKLTFSGAAASFDNTKQTLGIVGTGAGAGVQITNGSGNVITLGKAVPFQQIQDGNNTLRFSAYLKGNGGDIKTITAGEFSSVADFTLSYE
ncbi:type 1 fimbrial protein [Providencia rettgeri]|nr:MULTISPECIES: fimbrial protein [Providencia]EJD6412096.1 type 1 fimbrial protein [Providencia rettgeri]EJD6615518.1 type 1 fimbrial protein [Providencia rettgeri]ELL9151357.1 type 1 fimbrial protein [Providencia rettgeri]ELR5241472.1 type 1 fimbrial protein [Providencia rettgeri]MBG5894912.1 type 1 fimbrial protein [Providencia rettgeri]